MVIEKLREWAFGLVNMTWAFLAPIHTLMFATGAMILFDMITGIMKAMKAGEKITSNRMRHTISKSLAYQIAILSAFMLDTVMGLDLMASRVVAGVICLVEVKSVLENVEVMTGVQLWAALLERLKPPAKPEEKKDEK